MPGSPPPQVPGALSVVAATEAFFGYYPGSVAVLTSRDGARTNVMSAGWHTALSAEPPLYGVAVAPERHSHGLILASGWFGVNFLPFEHAEAIAGAGLLTGANLADKLAYLGLSHSDDPAGVPILASAYLAYACKLQDSVPAGDHDFFIGEVVRVHYDPQAFDGRLKSRDRRPTPIYYGRSTYESLGHGPVKQIEPKTFRDPDANGGS